MNNEMSVVLGTVAMEPKGEYNSSTYYEKLNVVTYNNSTYMATQPSQGIAPTNSEFWQFISSSGLAESDVIDNLESTATNKPLSAKQGNVLNKKMGSECEFIFPGQWGTTVSSGNSNIIKIKDKVLLFDSNIPDVYQNLLDMLDENNITHIDYMILSHFDYDHRGNIISLINDGYIDENSTYIHPTCLVEIYGQSVKDASDAIDALCQEKGIANIIPTENQIIEVNDEMTLRFGNVDDNYALANYTSPNECSMFVEVNHNGFCSLFTGDALIKAEKYIVDTQFIKNSIDLFTIPHHAIEQDCYTQLYNIINPKYAVAQAQLKHYNWGIYTMNKSSALLEEKGCANYYSYNNPENIKFIERFGEINCVQGIPLSHTGKSATEHNYYCDSVNYNASRQDGSVDYPFKDLPQALGAIKDWENEIVIINLKPGNYGYSADSTSVPYKSTCRVSSRRSYVRIVGNSNSDTFINKGFYISNCLNVDIRDVTIKLNSSNEFCAYIYSSNVFFADCIFEGNDNDGVYEGYGIRTSAVSKVVTSRCQFYNLNTAYVIKGPTKVSTELDLISNLTKYLDAETHADIKIGKFNTNSDFSTISNFDNNPQYIHTKPQNLSVDVSNIMTGSINLPIKTLNGIYKNLCIHYSLMNNSSEIGKGKKIIPFENITNLIISEIINNNNNTINTFTIKCTLTNKTISITQNISIDVASNGDLTSHTPSTSNDTSYGIKITKIDLI